MGTEPKEDLELRVGKETEENCNIPGKAWDKDWREFYFISL